MVPWDRRRVGAFLAPVRGREYWLDFPDGNPARCNPVTAPPECTAAALESL